MTLTTAQRNTIASQADTLLPEIKNVLMIYWSDETLDEKLTGLLERGMTRINNYAGVVLSFTENDLPKSLLFDYVRYAHSNCSDEFESAYLHDLDALRLDNMVEDDDEEEDDE